MTNHDETLISPNADDGHLFPPDFGHWERDDIAELIPPGVSRVLDIGCGTGAVAHNILSRLGAGVKISGVEIHPRRAKLAERFVDPVIVADADSLRLCDHFPPRAFDCIILADILEHLKDPWTFLSGCREFLSDGGVIVASIPNVRHWSTLFCLAWRSRWPRSESGIHDRTHLRFFARGDIHDLFEKAGYSVLIEKRNFGVCDDEASRRAMGIPSLARLENLIRLSKITFLQDFITVQFRVVAKIIRS